MLEADVHGKGSPLFAEAVTGLGIASRSAPYLRGFDFLVVGDGTVADVASGVLSTLGARVERQVVGSDDHAAAGRYHAVVCDRVTLGCDDDYLEDVERQLGGGADAPRAWVTASAFGLDGPARGFRGSDLVCAAAGGLLSAVYDHEGRVYSVPGAQALQTVGHLAALAALHGVILSGQRTTAVHLDLSAQEAVAFCTNQQTPSHVLHKCGVPAGAGRYSAPSGPFPCNDGQAQIIVVDDHQFARFAEAIQRPEWIPIFPTVADRVASAEMIDSVVTEWSSVRPKIDCEEYLQSRGVAATAVRPVSELLDSAQFQARGWPAATGSPSDSVVLPALVDVRASDQVRENRAMADLHVIEVSNVLAGPLTGAILGALGADVVRVEGTQRLDLYRQNGPFAGGIAGIERGAYFQGANYCKRSVTEAVAVANGAGVRQWADVVIENLGMKRVQQAGVEPGPPLPGKASMSLSISAFGRSGPGAGFRGYAQNVHAFAGLEDAVLSVAQRPLTMRMVLADYASAAWAATVVTAWWLGGAVDTEGVDLAMTEVIAGRMLRQGNPFETEGDDDHKHVVVNIPGSGYLALSIDGQDWAPVTMAALGVTSPAGATGPRLEEEATELLRQLAAKDAEQTVRALQEGGVAAYFARPPEQLVVDRQLEFRQFFMRLDHPVIGDSFLMALPWVAVDQPRAAWYRRAPMLGEDDDWARKAWWRPPAES